jgi:hypothetical protein
MIHSVGYIPFDLSGLWGKRKWLLKEEQSPGEQFILIISKRRETHKLVHTINSLDF